MKENRVYEYCITRDDVEWLGMSVSERYEVCQIAKEECNELSTEDLLQAILEYPYYTVMYNFDDVNDGFDELRSNFNAIDAFLFRDDAIQTLLGYYENFIVTGLPAGEDDG